MIVPTMKKVLYDGTEHKYYFRIDDGPDMAFTERDVASLRQKGDLTSELLANHIQGEIDAFKKKLPDELRRVYDLGKASRKWRDKSQDSFCVGMFSDHFQITPLVGSGRLVGRRGIEIADTDGDGKIDYTMFRTIAGVRVMIMAARTEYHFEQGDCTVIDNARRGVERYLAPLDALSCIGCNLD